MAPEIVRSKLDQIGQLLADLRKYEKISYKEFLELHHYAVERLLEILVAASQDAVLHVLKIRGEESPITMRTTFLRAGELGILPESLSKRLADAAGMRNLLVHTYSKVDLKIIYDSIKPALRDFEEFARIVGKEMGVE